MDRKTILHLSPLADIGGCEVNSLRVVEGLGGQDHRVLVFDREGPMSSQWRKAGARVDHLGRWSEGCRSFLGALRSWAESQPRPDGIFFWSTSRMPRVLGALRDWNVRWCVYLGNPVAPGLVSKARRWIDERLTVPQRSVTLAACSEQVAASHRRARYFRRFETEVIHNAVSGDFDRPRGHRPLPPGAGPRVGMVARLDVIKDHATLLRATAEIASTHPDVVVEFAGDGSLRDRLENEARRLGIGDRVRFLGFADVLPLLAAWDIYVHSTTAAEGMGTAVAEAMTAGLPCVVTDLPVMREVCGEDGARFFPPGDAPALGRILVELIENPAARSGLGRAAQERARGRYALPKVAAAYLRLVLPKSGGETA
jgi:glycosyltransferase involved in cell wall biosynthesis